MWISLDMHLNYVDENARIKKLMDMNLYQPKPYPPQVEKEIKNKIGFNKNFLEKKTIESIGNIGISLFHEREPSFFAKEVMNCYVNNKKPIPGIQNLLNVLNKEKFIEIYNLYNKYYKAYNDNEKIKEYYSHHKKYYEEKEKLLKEMCFVKSEYNKVGYLAQIEDFKTKKINSFLIGTKSNISSYYHPQSLVMRVKRIITEEEIMEDYIFE